MQPTDDSMRGSGIAILFEAASKPAENYYHGTFDISIDVAIIIP